MKKVENRNKKLSFSAIGSARQVLLFLASILVLSFFNPAEQPSAVFNKEVKSVVLQWYKLYLQLESKEVNLSPPISAERLALLGMAAHRSFDTTFGSNTNPVTLLCLNRVYAELLEKFYRKIPANEFAKIQAQKLRIERSVLGQDNEISQAVAELSKKIVSETVFQFDQQKHTLDSTAPLNASVAPPYQFNNTNPVLPTWGTYQTQVIDKQSVTIPAPYAAAASFQESLYAEAIALYTQSLNMDHDKVWIAEFWSDDIRGLTYTPVSRWISIANQIVDKKEIEARQLMQLYLRLGVGLNDAAVLCWSYKYQYKLLRPSDFINRNIDPKWSPLHQNPDFPGYPSGHAVFGATAVTILEGQFGTTLAMEDKSHQYRTEFDGKVRSFKNLREMAKENALSRFLMGVHFKSDCEAGLELGNEVGNKINGWKIEEYAATQQPPSL